eukprot:2308509-Pleurochrysis_carterae.AAC.1
MNAVGGDHCRASQGTRTGEAKASSVGLSGLCLLSRVGEREDDVEHVVAAQALLKHHRQLRLAVGHVRRACRVGRRKAARNAWGQCADASKRCARVAESRPRSKAGTRTGHA